MNCVIVGGGGFIGSHLTEALLNRQDDVSVFDRPSAPFLEMLSMKGATLSLGNFVESSDLERALTGAETVFHLVSTTVPKSSNVNPAFDVESNLVGTINLLNVAKNAGVKKIVFISSGGTIYGIPREIPINEYHPTDPICSYGIVKLAIEKYLHLFWTLFGLDYCILRVSNAYGERQPSNGEQGIIPTIIDKGLHNQEINIWGDGTIIRDYIHVSDVVNAFLKASAYQGEEKIFNISSGQGHTVNEIIHMVEGKLPRPLHVIYTQGSVSDVPVNILDNSRAKQCLNWSPATSLSEGISRTIKYMSERP